MALGLQGACSTDPYGFGSDSTAAPVEPSGTDTGTSTGTPEDPPTTTADPTGSTGRVDDTSASGDPPPGETSTTDGVGDTTDTEGPSVVEHCKMNVNEVIPDAPGAGLTSVIMVPDVGTIVDLRVDLQLTHMFIGDLRVGLLGGAGQVAIIDRPDDADYPDDGNCGGVNIDATLHDAAPDTVDGVCLDDANPGLFGEVRPDELLGPVFAGTPMTGSWQLSIEDVATEDTGTLRSWCLRIAYE